MIDLFLSHTKVSTHTKNYRIRKREIISYKVDDAKTLQATNCQIIHFRYITPKW